MAELADIFRVSATKYFEKYGQRMLPSHKRAIRDIILCRTEALGGSVYFCQQCEEHRYSYHSCSAPRSDKAMEAERGKNRHCPKCGNHSATVWLAEQSALLLPLPHFLVTVTLPAPLRKLARRNQKLVYDLMMRCLAQAIQKLARDPKFVGGEVGIIGVMQTWARDMHYHPHVHFIVTGGGVSSDGKKWLPAQRDYLLPHRAVAKIFPRSASINLSRMRGGARQVPRCAQKRSTRAFQTGTVGRLEDALGRRYSSGRQRQNRSEISRALHLSRGHLQQAQRCFPRRLRQFSLPG